LSDHQNTTQPFATNRSARLYTGRASKQKGTPVFKAIKAGKDRSPWIVVAVSSADSLPKGVKLSAEQREKLEAAISRPGFKAESGEIAVAGDKLMALGLGAAKDVKPDSLRTAGARLVRALDRLGAPAAQITVSGALKASSHDFALVGRAIAEGAGLANYKVDMFRGKDAKDMTVRDELRLSGKEARLDKGIDHGLTLADATNYARMCAATPPNICTPAWVADQAKKLARTHNMKCTVISAEKAEQMGMGGITNVGMGSANKPCMVMLHWAPRGAKKNRKLVLVGKTMTYDTGGYSLKISNGMKGMKYDKCGGTAVLGAMKAIAARKLPIEVIALLPAAENMVSDKSYRPDDIITMYGGTTVEVTNTDAEGRLILGDALAYACEKLKPTAIVDLATLTGGVVVALGSWSAGYFCNDEGLSKRVEAAADSSGEKVWKLPLWEEHRDFMRAQHADIWNSGPKRDGHPIQGAAFLSYFVDKSIPWAHIDIAGVSAVESDKDLYCTGPTGFGVRLVTELVESYAKR